MKWHIAGNGNTGTEKLRKCISLSLQKEMKRHVRARNTHVSCSLPIKTGFRLFRTHVLGRWGILDYYRPRICRSYVGIVSLRIKRLSSYAKENLV
ncbi:hypothetical protein CDAR_198071 [Caerostris darwini]|uniref:Uncharacterized protein n=1 Tax=Caerostris darwini TaxID=1538125 RepID=A0AAV4RED1_9ARAC|nr:hypothetical protein CDAR_198071 [Caerostris darwini]